MVMFTHDIWLGQWLFDLKQDIEGIAAYLAAMRSSIQARLVEVTHERDKVINDKSTTDYDRWFDEHVVEHGRLTGQYQDLLYNGAVLAIWMYFESRLLWLCRHELMNRERNAGNDDWDNLQAKCKQIQKFEGIVKHFKTFGIDLSRFPEWQKIKDIQMVRNVLVHGGGMIFRPSGVESYVKSREKQGVQGLSIIGNGMIVGAAFCHEMLQVIEPALERLLRRITPIEDAVVDRINDAILNGPHCPDVEPLLLPSWDFDEDE